MMPFLEKLNTLQQAMDGQVPYLHKVTSIINARYNYGEDGDMVVEDLLQDWPEQPLQQRWPDDSLKSYLMGNAKLCRQADQS